MRRTSRRTLLGGLPAVALAGCIGGSPGTDTATATPDSGTPDSGTPDVGSPTPISPDNPGVRWAVEFDDGIHERPSVNGGVVYVTTDDRGGTIGTPTTPREEPPGSLAAVSAADGAAQWRTPLPEPPASSPHVGARGVHLVAGYSSGYYGIGQQLWQFDRGGAERWTSDPVDQFLYPLAFDGERAYLGTGDDALSARGQPLFGVSLDDGSRTWEAESGDAFDGVLVDDTLLVSLAGVALGSYDPGDGRRNWTVDGEPLGDAREDVAVAHGAAFVARSGNADSAIAVDLDGGTERWTFAVGGYGNFVPTGVAGGDGVVLATEYDGVLFGLDPAGGVELWRFETDGQSPSGPLVVDGTVYVGDTGGGVYAVDPATGEQRWQRTVEGTVGGLGASDGVLVVEAQRESGRTVAGFDADGGTALWEYRFSADATRVALGDGRAYLGTADGTLVALGAE